MKMAEKFPELKSSLEAKDIPWKESLVWLDYVDGKEMYFWISACEILYVSWVNGVVSVIFKADSVLSSYFQSMVISSKLVFVGTSVKVGNL